ncbi:MAG: MerR family transcriptional regulator [Anaerolineaceae bacterium]|nr:MerR family transcriptional regulator [Anaerolineaceae bacterium]
MKLKIGEFARLGQVSVQTLRYYDDLGLIKAGEVDRFSGYRYYTLEQLPRLLQILALKDLGISLQQIGALLDHEMSNIELRQVLMLKQEELRNEVQGQLERMERIEARLRLLEQNERVPSYEVVIKQVEPIRVFSEQGKVSSYWEVDPLWMRLHERLGARKPAATGPYFTLCHASEPEIELEVCMPVAMDAEVDGLDAHVLPAVESMACTVHHGPFTGLITGFTALMTWVDANGYIIAGPDREIYLQLPEPGHFDSDPSAITELQIPVVKATA